MTATNLEFRDGKWRVKPRVNRTERRARLRTPELERGSMEAAIADALRSAWGSYATTGDWFNSVGITEMARVAAGAARNWTRTGPGYPSSDGHPAPCLPEATAPDGCLCRAGNDTAVEGLKETE